jgi:poly-gamma-glutamate synthesis protein (capsule biosynthesis protein)
VRLLALLLLLLPGLAQAEEGYRLLFTGDILLARETAHEIEAKHGASPWADLAGELHADFVMGNLEGAIGPASACQAPAELCFADDPKYLALLAQAGFTALGTANNHAGDLGVAGRQRTHQALEAAGIAPIGFDDSPAFLRLGGHTIGIVSLSLVAARDGAVQAVPSWQVAQKLRLARAVSDWVVVFVHWGKELEDWTVPQQKAQAEWLVGQGADLIIGAHPHVVQPPDCVAGKPVFYSLGNHVFDQKYADTKRGLIAECRIAGDRLGCSGLQTETAIGSSFPKPAGPFDSRALAGCSVPAGTPLAAGDRVIRVWTEDKQVAEGRVVLEGTSPVSRWRTVPSALVAAQLGTLEPGKPPMLFTLERHASSMDTEAEPRPYVYEITPHGLVARWRGSALAWPLLDARLIAAEAGGNTLCALHRGDSFIKFDPAHPAAPRVLAYRWNGFGFSGIEDAALAGRCRSEFPGLEHLQNDSP